MAWWASNIAVGSSSVRWLESGKIKHTWHKPIKTHQKNKAIKVKARKEHFGVKLCKTFWNFLNVWWKFLAQTLERTPHNCSIWTSDIFLVPVDIWTLTSRKALQIKQRKTIAFPCVHRTKCSKNNENLKSVLLCWNFYLRMIFRHIFRFEMPRNHQETLVISHATQHFTRATIPVIFSYILPYISSTVITKKENGKTQQMHSTVSFFSDTNQCINTRN